MIFVFFRVEEIKEVVVENKDINAKQVEMNSIVVIPEEIDI